MLFRKNIYKFFHWETWPYLVKYIPLAPVWCWYCLRSGTPWFFTPSNPTLCFGGFEGETKMEMYNQLPPGTYPLTTLINHQCTVEELVSAFARSGLQFPVAVKPDAGMMGFMFRQLQNEEQLINYHCLMPSDYLIQDLVDYPLEVSVFYYRYPGRQTGTITGFIRKEFLRVTGDGSSTLEQLVDSYPRATFRSDEIKAKHQGNLHTVLQQGEKFILSHALNLSRGGKLVSLETEKDNQLLKLFDDISLHTKDFYYGRYDIKCASIDSLKKGEDFLILEFNGCGAEPHHIYGNGKNLLQAYSIVLKHWKVLFEISSINHKKGIPYWSFSKGWHFLKAAKAHFKVLRKLDMSTSAELAHRLPNKLDKECEAL